MKNSDEAIEKVLAGLRNSEPPAGMELRILAAAKRRESSQPASSWLREKLLWLLTSSSQQRAWRVALVATTAAFLLAALIIPSIQRHRNPSTQSEFHPDATVTPTPVNTRESANLPRSQSTVPASDKHAKRGARLVSTTFPLHPHEMRNLSHPAPEAPLTQQEKLLLRVAQSGNPHVFAMLNTEIRTRREAEEDAEFQRFADPSVASPDGDSK
jgi:hypothetical protein